jgi:hypothetical protein
MEARDGGIDSPGSPRLSANTADDVDAVLPVLAMGGAPERAGDADLEAAGDADLEVAEGDLAAAGDAGPAAAGPADGDTGGRMAGDAGAAVTGRDDMRVEGSDTKGLGAAKDLLANEGVSAAAAPGEREGPGGAGAKAWEPI